MVPTIIISIIIAAIVLAIVLNMVKKKKDGKGTCCSGCSGCGMSEVCHKQ